MAEITDVRTATEEVNRSKAAAEKTSKGLTNQLNEINKKVESASLSLCDFENAKRKMAAENSDLLRQLQELENVIYMNVKMKEALTMALNEQKNICDEESRERISLLSKFRNMEHEYESLREHYEEELLKRENISCQLKKALSEVNILRKKYEIDGVQKAEELEMSKMKLQARLTEAHNTLDNLNNKQIQLEKAKEKLQADLNEMLMQLDQAQILQCNMEKRAKQYDRYALFI